MFLEIASLKRCLVIDIETVSEYPDYESLPDMTKKLWDIKSGQWSRTHPSFSESNNPSTLYIEKAGIFSEFSKIACISMGFMSFDGDTPKKIRLKTIAGRDEYKILAEFSKLLSQHYSDVEHSRLCGHNIKEFDIPFICRRMVIHGLKLPAILDISGKKPWQTQHLLDTMDMWRFGDYKNYTSLSLLSHALGIATPKDDIDGSMVGHVYWIDNDIERIVTYCQKDVVTVVQILLKFSGQKLITEENIEILN
ncbi:MAG: ribonuclease H-like domain-containing protein [Saprospiraceae bacterium]